MIERNHAHYYHSWRSVSFCAQSDKQYIGDLRRVLSAPEILVHSEKQVAQEMLSPDMLISALHQVTRPPQENGQIKNKNFAAQDARKEKQRVDSNNNLSSKDEVCIDIPDALLTSNLMIKEKKERECLAVPEINITISSEKGEAASQINAATLQSLIQRHGKNISQALGQKLLSVGISTALREYMSKRGFPALLQQVPASVSVSLGAFALATPIALQLAGIARDTCNGRQTVSSLSARLANLALVSGSIGVLSATVGIAAATHALLAAIFVYVPLRDIIQYLLPLRDNNPPGTNLCASTSSALLYGVNQTLVSEGMNLLSAALQPALERDFAEVCGKALVNTLGETVDEITWRRLNAQFKHNPALHLQWQARARADFTTQTLTDQLLNTIAARAALFGTSYSVAAAAPLMPLLSSLVAGATLGASYVPFIYTHSQSQPAPQKA